MPAHCYSKQIEITQCECDFQNHMKPSSILRQVQQIGNDHCNSVGITSAVYEETHTAFLLAKLSVEIYGDICAGDTVTMVTKPSAPIRAVYQRYTSFYNSQGKELAAVDGRWILVDTQTRKILRKIPEAFPFPFLDEKEEEQDVSIPRLSSLSSRGRITASYARCDQNGHINNAEYADIICDQFPMSFYREKKLSKLVLAYHHELSFGESMELLGATFPNNKDAFYFCGKEGELLHFEAAVYFR